MHVKCFFFWNNLIVHLAYCIFLILYEKVIVEREVK
nr:MAG TPA: hypothetical protein [Caudoviricetes sp.]